MTLAPLGTRQYQNTALAGSGQQPTRTTNTAQSGATTKASSNVALSPGSVDLQSRVDSLGNNTIDLAQNLLGSFAQKLFGDDAKGATIDFDSVSLDASSTMSAGVMQSRNADGVTNAAAFSLTDSSHFIGKGTITMADGSKYDFEVEVQYQASLQAGYTQNSADSGAKTEREKLIEQNPAMPLPAIDFPDVDWPGSLGDLFKLMDKQVSGDVVANTDNGDNAADKLGTLSMRLLTLVNSSQSLDTYVTVGAAGTKSAAQKYAAELAASSAATDKTPMPIKVATEKMQDPAPEPAPEPAAPPTPAPVVDTIEQPVKSATDIPLTISTTPGRDPAA